MALPAGKAMDLAKDMAKKGISGSIAMKEPPAPMDSEPGDDDTQGIEADLAKAVPGCDPASLRSLIEEICERKQGSYAGGGGGDEGPEAA